MNSPNPGTADTAPAQGESGEIRRAKCLLVEGAQLSVPVTTPRSPVCVFCACCKRASGPSPFPSAMLCVYPLACNCPADFGQPVITSTPCWAVQSCLSPAELQEPRRGALLQILLAATSKILWATSGTTQHLCCYHIHRFIPQGHSCASGERKEKTPTHNQPDRGPALGAAAVPHLEGPWSLLPTAALQTQTKDQPSQTEVFVWRNL